MFDSDPLAGSDRGYQSLSMGTLISADRDFYFIHFSCSDSEKRIEL